MTKTLADVWTPQDEEYLQKTVQESNGFSPSLVDVAAALATTPILDEDHTEVIVDDLVIRYVDGDFELEWI